MQAKLSLVEKYSQAAFKSHLDDLSCCEVVWEKDVTAADLLVHQNPLAVARESYLRKVVESTLGPM